MPFNTKLIKKEEVAKDTYAFYFEKPENFNFLAGQSLDWTLLSPPETDEKGNTRPFSIITSPDQESLGFATRMRDTAFKRVIKNAAPGFPIQFDGPFGDFKLHNNDKRAAVFLAGGIGVTPFYSIIKNAAHLKLPHQIYLFYSNRRSEDASFLEELKTLQQANPNYHFIGTMTQPDSSSQPWNGETGYINKVMLQKHLPELSGPIYYLAGPPGMVKSMRDMLNQSGIDGDDIRTEEFSGY